MPFTKFTNLDFDQIKTSIKDYLRANSNFTDFDFEGSNFSVLIDTLAYNTYITSFNSNMVVNESFLDSAVIRENVVSLARNIGYVPRSKTASTAIVSFSISVPPISEEPLIYPPTVTLQSGLVCTGATSGSSYVFSIPENITVSVINGVASFNDIEIKEGTFLTKQFVVNKSIDQKFILDNPFIDTTTIRVSIRGINDLGTAKAYNLAENIFNIDSNSEIFLIQEIRDEKYELLFGDGIFGKELENSSIITASYIVTSGEDGNGAKLFDFQGSIISSNGSVIIPEESVSVTTIQSSKNGSEIESIESIKKYAPRVYSSQYRAVTARDYESIIKTTIYPEAESVSVIGGEELNPPEFGKVFISIKPKSGSFVSDFNKQLIKNKLKQYTVSGINPEIIDLKTLYVEIDSSIYYNYSQVSSLEGLKTRIIDSLNSYAKSTNLNSFGGRFKYSKVLQVIDGTDKAITSNITKVRLRRDLKAIINNPTQYEICFGNKFHVNPNGKNVKTTGFKIFGISDTVYLTDTPDPKTLKTGIISVIKSSPILQDSDLKVPIVIPSAGTINYETGEILLGTLTITSTEMPNDVIEIQTIPESNDVIGLKDLYLSFDVSKSKINMVKDVISSGDDISGVIFSSDEYYRSSYPNGQITRM